jgi:hypothetical protein
MSYVYDLEKVSAFATSIGKDCYPPELEPVCLEEDEYDQEEGQYDADDQVSVRSSFIPEPPHVFWQTIGSGQFFISGTGQVKFTPPEKFDLLYNSYLQITFPRLSIKKEFADNHRISWSRYCCFNVIQKAEIKASGGTPFCSTDKYGLELCQMYMRDSAHTQALESDAGTCPAMNKWVTTIKEQKKCCPLYWSYCSGGTMFPIYKLGDKTLEHCFSFSKNIASHLRMKKFENGKWNWIKPNLNLLDGLPSDNKLQEPCLFGEFTQNTPHEKARVYNKNDDYYIDDIIWASSDNPITFGETFSIPLRTNGKLCRAIFGAVENITSCEYNDNFNFTDNPDDPEQGESPIESIFIYYGDVNTPKIGPYDMSHFESALITKHFKSSPTHPGHFAIALDYEAWKTGSGSGIVPEGVDAKLVCKLRDKREGDKDCKFNLVLRLKTSKKLTFVKKDKSLLCQ